MTKAELKTYLESKQLSLSKSYTSIARYYIIDVARFMCYNKVLNMVKYITNSSISITQVDLEMLKALVNKYSDTDKAIIKRF